MLRITSLTLLLLLSAYTGCALSDYKSSMLSYGKQYCNAGDNYYDAARVYYQIAEYTGDKRWERCAEYAVRAYVDGYLIPNNYNAAGYMIFPHGLLLHYKKTNDPTSKDALIQLAQKAAFARHEPAEWLTGHESSREVAYNIQSKLLAEDVGFNDRKEVERLVEFALGHYDQWFVSHTASYVRPFMAALTAEALILWYEKTRDPRVLPAIKTGADWMWANMWLKHDGAFKYTDRQAPTGGQEPSPDLNLLIAPMYGWLYKMTNDVKYRDMGDEIFSAGSQQAYLGQAKQFNQNFRWSPSYLVWRGTEDGLK
jgi:hypothetical protein